MMRLQHYYYSPLFRCLAWLRKPCTVCLLCCAMLFSLYCLVSLWVVFVAIRTACLRVLLIFPLRISSFFSLFYIHSSTIYAKINGETCDRLPLYFTVDKIVFHSTQKCELTRCSKMLLAFEVLELPVFLHSFLFVFFFHLFGSCFSRIVEIKVARI